MKNLTYLSAACLFAMCLGCSESDETITTDTHEDADHEHDDDHDHAHRDAEPQHGGQIVSIGHIHHDDGVTHFNAEVMPLTGDTIIFYLLTESEDDKDVDLLIEDATIPALISIKGQEADSQDGEFKGQGDGDGYSEFHMVIPEYLSEGTDFTVVIPKVKMKGQRQNFSFKVTRSGDSPDSAKDSDEDSSNE